MVKIETEKTAKKQSKSTGKASPTKKKEKKVLKPEEISANAPDIRGIFMLAKNTTIELEIDGKTVDKLPPTKEIAISDSFFVNNYRKANKFGCLPTSTYPVHDNADDFKDGFKIEELTVIVNGKKQTTQIAVQITREDKSGWDKQADYTELAEKAPFWMTMYNNVSIRRVAGRDALLIYRRKRRGGTDAWNDEYAGAYTKFYERIDAFLTSVGITETHCSEVIKLLKAGPTPKKTE